MEPRTHPPAILSAMQGGASPRIRRLPACGEEISRRVRNHWKDCSEAASSLHATHDPDTVHDARVASRRLRSALELAGSIVPEKRIRRARRNLRRLGRALGAVRECDVSAAILAGLEPSDDPARRLAREVLLAFEFERRDARWQILGRELGRLNLRKTGRELGAIADAALETPGDDLVSFARSRLEERRTVTAELLSRAVAHPTPRNLHALRIGVKKLRYGMELLSRAFDARRFASLRRRLKRLQELLGRDHDLYVVSVSLSASRRRYRSEGLTSLDRSVALLQRDFNRQWRRLRARLSEELRRVESSALLESIPAAFKRTPQSSETPALRRAG